MSSVSPARISINRWLGAFVIATVCALAVLVPAQAASAAASTTVLSGVRVNSAEARMIRLVNAARGRAGLPGLRLVPGYTDVARRWSRGMAARRTLVHNPRLAANVYGAGGAAWRAIGENVAYGYSADVVFRSYLNSPPHRANILSRSYRFVGIGWVTSGGRTGFTTLVFSSAYSAKYGPCRVAPARG